MTELAAALPDASGAAVLSRRMRALARVLIRRVVQLLVLLFSISTLLFFLLRLSGDPALILAGENADAEFIAHVERQYGLDQPLIVQYAHAIGHVFQLDFGSSVHSAENALGLVLDRMPATVQLAAFGILINLLVAVPIGAWLGSRPRPVPRAAVTGLLVIGQGVPGYVVGLLLIQVFAVKFRLLPSIGNAASMSWLLPSVTLAAFLVPRLTRVLATNVSTAMSEDYVRTARACGASKLTVVVRHALPNALLGATALVGGQFAFLLSGALITEVIFAWPGVGRLLIDSVLRLDFPVVQATVFVVAFLVFLVNAFTDVFFSVLDPRLRRQRT
ncbi:ABC transporter permease [Sphaerimonospora sp. CA-214678]|uniref:ABC transporter permease n=1 Tax=Sphaerimonospora sp. CA-214678 TaxID=3240029 RepID=UPI003D9172C1